jgi:UDP-N-acetyl-D-mannosaminuronate dehydrogenase
MSREGLVELEDGMHSLVVGLGEVGGPLLDLLSSAYPCIGRDLEPVAVSEAVSVMHVCYPYAGPDFVTMTVEYIREYTPQLTIIHSTIVPGTTQWVAKETGGAVAYSPVRGKHSRMRDDLLLYTKFVAASDPAVVERASAHLAGAGLRTAPFLSPEGLELAKLLETTYLGILIGWAQEAERFCRSVGAEYNDVMAMMREIDYLPSVIFRPGFIGGHCVIPNTYLLEQVRPSAFIDVLRASNEQRRAELLADGRSPDERLTPQKVR